MRGQPRERLTVREHTQRRDLVAREMHVRAETIDDATRSVEAVITTENPATVFDWNRLDMIDEVLVARGMNPVDQVVLLAAHNRFSLDSVLGSIRMVRIEGSDVIGRLHFAANDPAADAAWNKVRQGHLTDVSAGYRAAQFEDIPPGQTRRINGKNYTAGDRTLRITTQWVLREGSVVPIGADAAAKIRREHTENETMNAKLRKYLESLGLRADASEEAAWAFFQQLGGERKAKADSLRDLTTEPGEARTDGETGTRADPPPEKPSPAAPAPDPAAIADEAVRAERDRQTAIRALAGDDVPGTLIDRALNEAWSLDRARAAVLEHIRGAHAPAVHTARDDATDDERRTFELDAIAAGLLHRCDASMAGRIQERRGTVDPQRAERLARESRRYNDLSLLDICREACRLAGGSTPRNRSDLIVRATSTGEFSHIFDAVVNAQLQMSYTEAPDTTMGWVRETDVPDFKTNERWRMGKSSNLSKLSRGDAAGHAKIGDNSESYSAARYARQFVIDEQDIIDDSLNALQSVPVEMGAAARRVRPDLIYSLLLANGSMEDTVALFHATHANLGTGGGSALSAATCQTGIAAMAKQTEDGVNLNLAPAYLIVPQDLRFAAEIILQSAERVIASASGGTFNPLRGMLKAVADNRIGTAGVTSPSTGTAYAGSATNWFLATGASQPMLEVGYVRGTGRAPVLRTFNLTEGRFGVGFDVHIDVGAVVLDWRGLYKADGA